MRRCATRSRTSAAEERALLAPHFTNLDRPVFALVNLPETVKGALFARYSRYSGTVRRLYLEEFAADVAGRRAALRRRRRASARRSSTSGSSSATATTRSPRSAAPTSPASGSPTSSPRCSSAAASPPTWSSRPATSPTTSRCPRTPAAATATTATSELGPEFAAAMDELFSIYSRSLERGRGVGGRALAARRRRAGGRLAALDPRQGARPAARPAAGGDAEPRRHLRLRPGLRAADPAADGLAAAGGARVRRDDPARAAAGDAELRLAGRAARPRRRVGLLPGAAPRADRELGRAARARPPRRRRGRALGRADPRRRQRRGPARLLPVRGRRARRRPRSAPASTSSTATSAPSCSAALVGERANRRHRPGRGFEALRYRFEIVSDYGAFRDLQRHRMLTCQWQRLGPDLGAGVPDEVARGGRRRRVRAGAGGLARGVRAARRRRPRRAGALRALPRLPDPLRARPQRARGDAPDRAALGPRGPPRLPRRRPGDARADRRDPPRGRRGDEPRRHLAGAAPGADPERDPHPAASALGAGGAAPRRRPGSTRSAEGLSRAACASSGAVRSRGRSAVATCGSSRPDPAGRRRRRASSAAAFSPGVGQGIGFARLPRRAGGRRGTQPSRSRPR